MHSTVSTYTTGRQKEIKTLNVQILRFWEFRGGLGLLCDISTFGTISNLETMLSKIVLIDLKYNVVTTGPI